MIKSWIPIEGTRYVLKSDIKNWIVGIKSGGKNGDAAKDPDRVTDLTYHPSLAGAFKRIFDETVRLSDYNSVIDLLRITEDTHKMLTEIFGRDFKGK